MSKCDSCDAILTGRRRKYCSNTCRGKGMSKCGATYAKRSKGRKALPVKSEPGEYEQLHPLTIGIGEVKRDVLRARESYSKPLEERPKTRGDCKGGDRPCLWISCVHNLYCDVGDSGGIKLHFPSLEPHEMVRSCSLDIADRGGHTLKEVGDFTNVTRERVRQVEAAALVSIRRRSGYRSGAEKGNDLSDWRDSVKGGGSNDE